PDRRMIRVAEGAAKTTAEYFEKTLPEKSAAWAPDPETKRAVATASAAAGKACRDFHDGLVALYFATPAEGAPITLKKAFDRDAVQRLVAYARKNGMFAPPEDYRLDVVFTPPPLRETIDAAYYPAPPFKKTGVGQFYVTPTGDDASKLRAHARATIASLAAHE